MNTEIDLPEKDAFHSFLKSIQMRSVQFIDIHSRILSGDTLPEGQKTETNVAWKQLFPVDDPLRSEKKILTFRPKYEFSLSRKEEPFFVVEMIAAVNLEIIDVALFEQGWADTEIQKLFREKQIVRIMWTILRQQLMDCMNRHSIPPVTLPWIL